MIKKNCCSKALYNASIMLRSNSYENSRHHIYLYCSAKNFFFIWFLDNISSDTSGPKTFVLKSSSMMVESGPARLYWPLSDPIDPNKWHRQEQCHERVHDKLRNRVHLKKHALGRKENARRHIDQLVQSARDCKPRLGYTAPIERRHPNCTHTQVR